MAGVVLGCEEVAGRLHRELGGNARAQRLKALADAIERPRIISAPVRVRGEKRAEVSARPGEWDEVRGFGCDPNAATLQTRPASNWKMPDILDMPGARRTIGTVLGVRTC